MGNPLVTSTQIDTNNYNHFKISKSIAPEAAALGGVAVGILTAGAGSSVGAGIASLGGIQSAALTIGLEQAGSSLISVAASNLTRNTLLNNGDIKAGYKQTVSKDGRKAIATAAVSAGVTGGFSSEFGVTVDNQTLRPLASTDVTQRVGYAAINTLSRTGIDVGINGVNIGSALVDNLRANIADQVQSVGSSAIGKSYFDGDLNYLDHKLAHLGLGGASASITGGNIASGALGASVAEATGEAAFGYGINTATVLDIAKISGASAGLLTGDVNTAANSASIATENNLAPFIVANSARAVAVEACVANPACMAAASAIALETGKKLNEAVDYLIKISGTNPLPGFDIHTPEASVLTTPEHKSDWSLETLPSFDLYDSSLVTLGENYSFDLEGFSTLPDWMKNESVIINLEGKLHDVFSPINKGPLPDKIVETFRGGNYSKYTLTKDLEVYRAYGGAAQPNGGFWTTHKPYGPLQAQIDLALKNTWGNTAKKVNTKVLPAGTTIFYGKAESQGDFALGGGDQIFIPELTNRRMNK